MSDRMLPVCNPQLLEQRGAVGSIEALAQLPLLHDSGAEGDGSLTDWRSWLDQLGRPEVNCRGGQRFSHAGLSIEAAVLGLGVALARLSLVADHLTSGTLVCPLTLTTPTAFSYFLVAPAGVPESTDLTNFREWLHTEAKEVEVVAARLHAAEAEVREALFSSPEPVQ
jgi:LysR family glycine cleavage system transcriptional activator